MSLKNNIIQFKSITENYNKEFIDLKRNTLRKVDKEDRRFILLQEMYKSKIFGKISIKEVNTERFFIRHIKDITYYENWVIISW